MTMATATHDLPSQDTWFQRAEAWLDQRGKPAWITAMVLGFIFFWPIGLAFLAYMIWRKPMLCHARSSRRNKFAGHGVNRSSGNAAFVTKRQPLTDCIKSKMNFTPLWSVFELPKIKQSLINLCPSARPRQSNNL